MNLLPESPRRRRRLLALVAVVLTVAVVGAVFLLTPNKTPPNPKPPRNEGPAQLATRTSRHVSPADRRAINALFDKFVPAALDRRSADVAWSLASPDLRAGTTLAQWRRGVMPVPSYPALGHTFHDWNALDATATTVDYSLLVHPRPGRHLSAYAFQGELVKIDGHWRVSGMYTTAVFAKPNHGLREIGPADFTPPPASDNKPLGNHGALGRGWLTTLIAILVALLVLVPTVLGLGVLIKRRRWNKRVQTAGRTELPPLPSATRSEQTERDRTPVT